MDVRGLGGVAAPSGKPGGADVYGTQSVRPQYQTP